MPRGLDGPGGAEPRRSLDAQRGEGMPRSMGAQRSAGLSRRPELDRGPDTQRDYADRGRRRERDTSWQRELESGAWKRDPESRRLAA